jgi:TetR/AcrR family transcriptional regulator, ethionamide resistance regulator
MADVVSEFPPADARPKRRRTRAEQRAELRKRLLVAVETLLATQPFPDITIDQILAQAGVSRATFYTNFSDKASLLLALADDFITDSLQVASPWWDIGPGATREQLESVLGSIFDMYLEHRVVQGAISDAAGYEPSIKKQVVDLQDDAITKLTEHIRRGQENGFIDSRLAPAETAGWLIWMIERGLYTMASSAGTVRITRLLTSLTDIIWKTLYEFLPRHPATE